MPRGEDPWWGEKLGVPTILIFNCIEFAPVLSRAVRAAASRFGWTERSGPMHVQNKPHAQRGSNPAQT